MKDAILLLPDRGVAPRPQIENGMVVGYSDGMTMRQYFAANAPAEPQAWFQPTIPTARPEIPKLASIADTRTRDDVRVAMEAGVDPETPEAAEWLEQHNQAYRDRDAWDCDARKERALQWPWAWADAVLARGEK